MAFEDAIGLPQKNLNFEPFMDYFFWSKMCVLCMFYVDWELGGQNKL